MVACANRRAAEAWERDIYARTSSNGERETCIKNSSTSKGESETKAMTSKRVRNVVAKEDTNRSPVYLTTGLEAARSEGAGRLP